MECQWAQNSSAFLSGATLIWGIVRPRMKDPESDFGALRPTTRILETRISFRTKGNVVEICFLLTSCPHSGLLVEGPYQNSLSALRVLLWMIYSRVVDAGDVKDLHLVDDKVRVELELICVWRRYYVTW